MAQNSIRQKVKTRLSSVLNVPMVNHLRGVLRPDTTGAQAQTAIARMIVKGSRLVARVNATGGRATAFYLNNRLTMTGTLRSDEAWSVYEMKAHSGYFPISDASIDRLAALYLQDIATIDLYAAWTQFDGALAPGAAQCCQLRDLDPIFTRGRWPPAPQGRKVAVVILFSTTIKTLWTKRAALFDVDTMPDCDMHFLTALQTRGKSDVADQGWFANVDAMDAQIADASASVAILGAGTYGLQLGARAKRRGATAIVLGGSTQLLFGIMGNRWMLFPEYRALLRPWWTRPGRDEQPVGYETLETAGGGYW